MDNLMEFVKPELLVVAVVLYFLGMALEKAQAVKDKFIPLILGGVGILICGIYVFATCSCNGIGAAAMALFTSITQGILVSGASYYVHQVATQLKKKE